MRRLSEKRTALAVKGFATDVHCAREAAGMTQTDLAKACGMSHVGIGNIERGDSVPTLGSAMKIATALGIDLGSYNK